MIANWNKRKILLMCKFQFSEGLISNASQGAIFLGAESHHGFRSAQTHEGQTSEFSTASSFHHKGGHLELLKTSSDNPHVIFDVISVESPAQHHVLLNRLGRRIAGASNLSTG